MKIIAENSNKKKQCNRLSTTKNTFKNIFLSNQTEHFESFNLTFDKPIYS